MPPYLARAYAALFHTSTEHVLRDQAPVNVLAPGLADAIEICTLQDGWGLPWAMTEKQELMSREQGAREENLV